MSKDCEEFIRNLLILEKDKRPTANMILKMNFLKEISNKLNKSELLESSKISKQNDYENLKRKYYKEKDKNKELQSRLNLMINEN